MLGNRDYVRRLSRRMQMATTITIVVIVLGVIYGAAKALFDPAWLSETIAGHFGVASLPVSTTTAVLIVLLFLGQVAIFLFGLACLRNAFAVIAKNDAINGAAGMFLRRAGMAFAASTLAMVLFSPLATGLYSLGAPAGGGFITVKVGTGELMTLLMSGVFIVIGHLIAVAAEIDDDNRQIV